jgi:hypothetical protein
VDAVPCEVVPGCVVGFGVQAPLGAGLRLDRNGIGQSPARLAAPASLSISG